MDQQQNHDEKGYEPESGLAFPILPSVYVVVLFWNEHKDTIECVKSLIHQDIDCVGLVIVDNGSTDDSSDEILRYLKNEEGMRVERLYHDAESNKTYVIETFTTPHRGEEKASKPRSTKNVAMIVNSDNLGYAGGNNVGIDYCMQSNNVEYVIVANNDTVADSSLVRELIDSISPHKTVGIAGPTIEWLGRVSMMHRSHEELNDRNSPFIDTDVSGCFLALRAEAIRNVGVFDESFFLYFEETDLFVRARRQGFRVVYVPTNAKATHKSSLTISRIGDLSIYHLGRSATIFVRKNHSFRFARFFVSCTANSVLLRIDLRAFVSLMKGVSSGLRLRLGNADARSVSLIAEK